MNEYPNWLVDGERMPNLGLSELTRKALPYINETEFYHHAKIRCDLFSPVDLKLVN